MAKFPQTFHEEIARIKGEYYCGTAKAVEVYKRVMEARRFAQNVNVVLRYVGQPRVGWSEAYGLRMAVEAELTLKGGPPIKDDSPLMVTLAAKLQVDLSCDRVPAELGDVLRKTAASKFNEVSITPGEMYLCLDSSDLPKGYLPRHMRQEMDFLYIRAREEGALGNVAVQRAFLARSAKAAGAASVEALARHFRHIYEVGQSPPALEAAVQANPFVTQGGLADTYKGIADAASYGLGLLSRSDLRGWLRKYLGA